MVQMYDLSHKIVHLYSITIIITSLQYGHLSVEHCTGIAEVIQIPFKPFQALILQLLIKLCA